LNLMRYTRFWLLVVVFMAVFAPFIANERPLWCTVEGRTYWPAWRTQSYSPAESATLSGIEREGNWASLYPDAATFTLIPYSSNLGTLKCASPATTPAGQSARFAHWLGTDQLGRDVLAALIRGTRTALWVALWSVLVALLLGGTLGALAGYLGDGSWRLRRGVLWLGIIGLVSGVWLALIAVQQASARGEQQVWFVGIGWFTGVFLLFLGLGWGISRFRYISTYKTIPLDSLVMRAAEVFQSIPSLIFIFAVAAIWQSVSLAGMVTLIGLRSWPGPARYLRAEVMRIKQMEYVTAAQGLGLSRWRVVVRHILPNTIRPVLAVAALGMGEAILLESSLSFLGLGTSDVTVLTWGKMLHAARTDFALWWIWLPPGLMIGAIVMLLFAWSESFVERPMAATKQ
jgi:peptide/nickel transport system permease protein